MPDLKKEGGKYLTVTGIVKKIDTYNQIIYLANNTQIPINEIIDIIMYQIFLFWIDLIKDKTAIIKVYSDNTTGKNIIIVS